MIRIKIYFTVIVTLLFSSDLISQNFTIKGQFTGENLEKSFINVINTTQYEATISQLDGKFSITAQVGDSILISSIQYKDVKFVVKEEFKSEHIKIPLKLKINELDDVDVYSLGLTGDLEKDADNIQIDESIAFSLSSFDISNAYDPEVTTQSEFTLRNLALEKNQPNIPTNFNIIGIAGALVNTIFKKKKTKNKKGLIETESHTLTYNDILSLKHHLNLEEEEIENFMSYAYANGLDKISKKNTNELDLVQFLLELSNEFKNAK